MKFIKVGASSQNTGSTCSITLHHNSMGMEKLQTEFWKLYFCLGLVDHSSFKENVKVQFFWQAVLVTSDWIFDFWPFFKVNWKFPQLNDLYLRIFVKVEECSGSKPVLGNCFMHLTGKLVIGTYHLTASNSSTLNNFLPYAFLNHVLCSFQFQIRTAMASARNWISYRNRCFNLKLTWWFSICDFFEKKRNIIFFLKRF